MASKIPQKEEKLGTEGSETPSDRPLFDVSDAAVRDMIRTAKKRGYVTDDQIHTLLASEEVNSEQIENILAKFNAMGINVVENKEARIEERAAAGDEPQEEQETGGENELVEIQQQSVPAKSVVKEPAERTDDPVRIYLREMASVELLTREGEIAIAKRLEAGREAMITGLCECPLTFQAITIWRDELNDGKALLRDIIDIDATYGPDAKAEPAPQISADSPTIASITVTGQPVAAIRTMVPDAIAQRQNSRRVR
jgi:RNA polymerase primary sigma factor